MSNINLYTATSYNVIGRTNSLYPLFLISLYFSIKRPFFRTIYPVQTSGPGTV